ncbi:Uncharacterised protein [Mycobacteroides abscessus subsp. massiliense]|nr:Uncharacterised protein [Mycobacteroides abscessus subsp. massiliense]
MKCPACNREIGHHAPERDGKAPLVICPRTKLLVELKKK